MISKGGSTLNFNKNILLLPRTVNGPFGNSSADEIDSECRTISNSANRRPLWYPVNVDPLIYRLNAIYRYDCQTEKHGATANGTGTYFGGTWR